MSAAFAVAIVLLAQGTSPAPLAESWTACKATSADVVIEGCTAVILAGTDTPQDLANAYHLRANAHRARHLLDLAMQDYDEAIKLDSHLIDAVGNRGITLIVMGRFADAIPDLTKVMEADPKSAYATYDRGLAYEALGLTDLAIE